jgi:hypothetical protein
MSNTSVPSAPSCGDHVGGEARAGELDDRTLPAGAVGLAGGTLVRKDRRAGAALTDEEAEADAKDPNAAEKLGIKTRYVVAD